jgi:hypothetical protein
MRRAVDDRDWEIGMRRLLTLATAVMLVVSAGAGVTNADTGGGCSGPTQCRTSGLGMEAAWYGVPLDGPAVGTTYTDTFLSAGSTMTASRGTRTRTAGAWFSQLSYRYDDLATKPTMVGESFTTDMGPDLVVRVDRNLGTATVSGTVMVVTCTIDASFNETCGEPLATTVSGTWTATGARLQTVSTYHAKGPGITMNQTFQGLDRQAIASATIGGHAIPGAIGFGDISDSTSNSVFICHAPAC